MTDCLLGPSFLAELLKPSEGPPSGGSVLLRLWGIYDHAQVDAKEVAQGGALDGCRLLCPAPIHPIPCPVHGFHPAVPEFCPSHH